MKNKRINKFTKSNNRQMIQRQKMKNTDNQWVGCLQITKIRKKVNKSLTFKDLSILLKKDLKMTHLE